ncbi:MAG: DUF58 domain-containing protein [Verrucomicrobia bacterium]|nr:DUF58 domain-containing protein [Verrucomicrobiota bacterium]
MTDAQIHDLDIRCRHAVEEMLAGEYLSVFKGRGIEFEDVRPYEPGDDVRSIDWNVTARAGKPFVKRFIEERDLTVYLIVDVSASSRFGSRADDKLAAAAGICGLLAHAAIRNHDRAGLILFTDEVECHLPPAKGLNQVARILDLIQNHPVAGRGTDLRQPLDFLMHVTRRRGVVFLISDFQATGYEEALESAALSHDLIAVRLHDPRESSLPADGGICRVRDNETGRIVWLDSGDGKSRREYAERAADRDARVREGLQACGAEVFEVVCGEDYVVDLRAFLQARLDHRR